MTKRTESDGLAAVEVTIRPLYTTAAGLAGFLTITTQCGLVGIAQ
jgi:hypothetical protein